MILRVFSEVDEVEADSGGEREAGKERLFELLEAERLGKE